jgi:hypothetical protein
MSLCYQARKSLRCIAGFLLALTVASPLTLVAQDDTPPKVDIFVGYQWLNPGGNVPDGFDTSGGRIPFKLPSIPQGLGVTGAYNFSPHWALEGD